MNAFERILAARGLSGAKREEFLSPRYEAKHDPFLLPDMRAAVDRLKIARQKQESITIYGDYDIDGLTATTLLLDALKRFGFEQLDAFIPNRFVEGYGLTVDAIERIAAKGANLILTVDCGSLSEKEIVRAAELGVDVIVTDHHNVAPTQPPAVAVINPKRLLQDYPDEYEKFQLKSTSDKVGKLYPFLDLAGCGVAFKLVQALQTELDGLKDGQEKWLLDLVALGTVCDIVTLADENRANVYWGLKVLAKTQRPGLKALMAVAGVDQASVNARSLGFALGPRMNAAGRLETAQIALDMLIASDGMLALEKAQQLDVLNATRRKDQDTIYKAAIEQAEVYNDDNVLVVSSPDWNHGIVGIVAAKLLEKYAKPTFVLQEMGSEAKGSARSYGDFSAADAIRASESIITKGGGHVFAAGVTLPTENIAAFRESVNEFYTSILLVHHEQRQKLLPIADTVIEIDEVDEELLTHIAALEPFGGGNPEPVLHAVEVLVTGQRTMGAEDQHVKLTVQSNTGKKLQLLAFNAPEHFYVSVGSYVSVWFQPTINEWQGRRTVEGVLRHLEHIR